MNTSNKFHLPTEETNQTFSDVVI